MKVKAYTDGACRGNPGVGAYGVILINEEGMIISQKGGERKMTTNNEMELGGVFIGVKEAINLKAHHITIYTDSKYVINSLSKWIYGWKKNAWKTKTGNSVKNQHILRPLGVMLNTIQHDFVYVPGHSGNKYNEIVDEFCNVILDEYYPETIPQHRKT